MIMIWRSHLCLILVALVAFLPVGAAAQTRIEAPGGVAAQTITNSPISIGATPAEQQALVAIFSQQIAVTSEARAKAEGQKPARGRWRGWRPARRSTVAVRGVGECGSSPPPRA
jgi:hypothetical protein